MDDLLIHRVITNSFVALFALISLIISFGIVVIHSRRPFLKQNFFKVIFSLSIYETLLYFFLLVNAILFILKVDSEIVVKLISFIITVLSTAMFAYNILIILYLFSQTNTKDSLIDKEIENDHSTRVSIHLMSHSFRYMDIIAIIAGAVHGGVALLLEYSGCFYNNFMYINSNIDNSLKDKLKLLVFIPNYLFFIISIPYFLSSWNKEKITDKIKLKKFATYCFIVSFLWCIYPILIALSYFITQSRTLTITFMYITAFSMCISMFIADRFRLSCYYIHFILQGNGEKCCNMFGTFFRIVFAGAKIPELNFVDYNSSFIYHSIATAGDFVSDANLDIDFSRDSILQEK